MRGAASTEDGGECDEDGEEEDGGRALFASTMVFRDEDIKARLIASGLLVRYTDVKDFLSKIP